MKSVCLGTQTDLRLTRKVNFNPVEDLARKQPHSLVKNAISRSLMTRNSEYYKRITNPVFSNSRTLA